MSRYNYPEPTPERIQLCKEWLARNDARLEQRKKMWEDQYPWRHPNDNQRRLHDIEATEFWIEMHRWELDGVIKAMDEEPNLE